MIFSGQVRDYKCLACGFETQQQYSTALGYWAALIAVSCGVLFPVLRRRFGPHHGGYGLAVIAADLALLILLAALTAKWQDRRVPADRKCPRCSGQLQRIGGGFYDFALVPTLSDILVGLGFLLAQVVALVLLLRR